MQRPAVSPECHRIGSPPSRFPPLRLLLSAAAVLAVVASWPALAQVQQEAFSYPVGLDPYGDNFLALRSLPSGTQGVRLARLGPDTLFTELGRQGGWVNIQLPSGQT
ncbi:peptidase C14, partial [Methylobacterium sp. J-077]|nr:peptidase C14 [Methylobacterium sp. J-077]